MEENNISLTFQQATLPPVTKGTPKLNLLHALFGNPVFLPFVLEFYALGKN